MIPWPGNMRSKKQLKTPITPPAGQKGDAQVKGAAPGGANRHDPAQKGAIGSAP
jgi:hypothetical protein